MHPPNAEPAELEAVIAASEAVNRAEQQADLDAAMRAVQTLQTVVLGLPEYPCVAHAIEPLLAALRTCYGLLKPREGAECGRIALDIAVATGMKVEQRKALTFISILLAEANDLPEAIATGVHGLQLATELGDDYARCSALSNLALALSYGGAYSIAIECAKAVVRVVKRINHDTANRLLMPAYSNLSLFHLQLDDPEGAFRFARLADDVRFDEERPSDAVITALSLRNLSRASVELERWDDAADACERLAALAARVGTPHLRWIAGLTEGHRMIFAGQVADGFAMLAQVREEALQFPSQREDYLTTMIRVYERVGDLSNAAACVQQLQDSLRRTRVPAEVLQPLAGLPELQSTDYEFDAPSPDLPNLSARERALSKRAKLIQGASTAQSATQALLDRLDELATTVELREDPSGEHTARVGRLAARIAARLGWSSAAAAALERAARLHDLGKAVIPDSIILKRASLSDRERQILMLHPEEGARMLSGLPSKVASLAEVIARQHHEWFDGRGYPVGLRSTAIDPAARIVAVADAYDALTHDRPYRSAWSHTQTLAEIKRLAGTQFDPEVVAALMHVAANPADLAADTEPMLSESPLVQAIRNLRSLSPV